jgi:polyhydroxybutyrate depolymerase
MGYSNGGFMALRLACEMGDRLAAVASVAGAGPPSDMNCRIASSLDVLAIHGDRDAVVRYQGGRVFDDPDRPKHESARETLAAWGKRLKCDGTPHSAGPLDLDARPGQETRVLRLSDCALGGAELWTVSGGSHSVVSSPNLVAEVWRFFVAHPKR